MAMGDNNTQLFGGGKPGRKWDDWSWGDIYAGATPADAERFHPEGEGSFVRGGEAGLERWGQKPTRQIGPYGAVGHSEQPTYGWIPFTPETPPWIRESDLGYLAGLDPGVRRGEIETARQDWENEETALATQSWNEGILNEAENRILNDPNYQTFLGNAADTRANMAALARTLEERSAPGYQAVTNAMMQPARTQVLQGGAQQQAQISQAMAARGLGRSGAGASAEGSVAGQVGLGLGQVSAAQATANEQGRQWAIGALSDLDTRIGALNLDVQRLSEMRSGALGNLDLAKVQNATGLMPLGATDYYQGPMLQWGIDEAEQNRLDSAQYMEQLGQQIDRAGRIQPEEYGLSLLDFFTQIYRGGKG